MGFLRDHPEKEIQWAGRFMSQTELNLWRSKRNRIRGPQHSCHGNRNLATPEEYFSSSVLGKCLTGAGCLSFSYCDQAKSDYD